MTMHLLPVYYTTTRKSTPAAKKPFTNAHKKWVEKMTGGKKSDKDRLSSEWTTEYAESIRSIKSENKGIVAGSTAPKKEMVYGGELRLIGVATMHKSNAVPVFSREVAADIARMRRG